MTDLKTHVNHIQFTTNETLHPTFVHVGPRSFRMSHLFTIMDLLSLLSSVVSTVVVIFLHVFQLEMTLCHTQMLTFELSRPIEWYLRLKVQTN